MSDNRKNLNIFLIVLSIALGGWAVWISRQPSPLIATPTSSPHKSADSVADIMQPRDIVTATPRDTIAPTKEEPPVKDAPAYRPAVRSTTFTAADIRKMTANHPFRLEAQKILSGGLEENDSISRHRILSYCEHLRTSYTTRDIDFLRQVFSDDALIIVGHVVKSGASSINPTAGNANVRYSIRSKHDYLTNLTRIFDSGKPIDIDFSGFRIMRHPTMEGIYGVTLRQKYSCGKYSDDGYLFLLWDFRNPSMPLIHVRTWQAPGSIGPDGEGLIDMSDFNLE